MQLRIRIAAAALIAAGLMAGCGKKEETTAQAPAASAAAPAAQAMAGLPKVVSGPGENPACFKPWDDKTKFFQWPAKPGPYRIALANGFVGNTWRIQMIKMAKAFAETPEMKPLLKEFKIVSTGTDVAAQVAAIDNFINSGYDAIVMHETGVTWPANAVPERLRGTARMVASKCDLCYTSSAGPACVRNCPQGCATRVSSVSEFERLRNGRSLA